MSEHTEKIVLTPVDVAKLLHVSRNTAYEIFHSKGFPGFKVGKQLRVRHDRLMIWLDSQERSA